MPPPTLKELIAQLRQKYPHLSDEALRILAEQQVTFEDLPSGTQGSYYPLQGRIALDPDEPDIDKTAMHELAHVFDYGSTLEPALTSSLESDKEHKITNAFEIASSAFGADQALMNIANLPAIPTPGYLQPLTSLGNLSTSFYASGAGSDPGWGPAEALAEVFAQSGGNWGLIPPSLLNALAPLGSPSTDPAQKTWEELSSQQQALPPKTPTPETSTSINRRIYNVPKRSAYKPPGLSKSKPKTKPPTRASARSRRIRSRRTQRNRTRRF